MLFFCNCLFIINSYPKLCHNHAVVKRSIVLWSNNLSINQFSIILIYLFDSFQGCYYSSVFVMTYICMNSFQNEYRYQYRYRFYRRRRLSTGPTNFYVVFTKLDIYNFIYKSLHIQHVP
jgi:hypothetical protein